MQRANQEYAAAVARASYVPLFPAPLTIPPLNPRTEALYAQISETLRGILSDDEFAAEAPG
jgi:hypothetical protein